MMKIAQYLLESVNELNETLMYSGVRKNALRNILGSIMGLTFSKRLLLFLYDPNAKRLKILSSANFDSKACKNILLPLDEEVKKQLLCKYCAPFGEFQCAEWDLPLFGSLNDPHIIPLCVDDEVIGMMVGVSVREKGYTEGDEKIFLMIKNNLAIHLLQNYSPKKKKKQGFKFDKYSYPISQTLYRGIYLAKEARAKHDILFNTVETVIKYISAIGIAFYKTRNVKIARVEKELDKFIRPSLGTWLDVLEAIYAERAALSDDFFIRGFFTHIFEKQKRDPLYEVYQGLSALIQRRGNIQKKSVKLIDFLKFCIVYRNERIGHSATVDDDEIRETTDLLLKGIECVLLRLRFLFDYPLIYIEEVTTKHQRRAGRRERSFSHVYKACVGTNIVYGEEPVVLKEDLESDTLYLTNAEYSEFLPLYPMMIFRECEKHKRDEVLFLNYSAGENLVDYISYQCGWRFKPKDYFEDIRCYFDFKRGDTEAYREAVRIAMKNGEITDQEKGLLEIIRKKYNLSVEDAMGIEAEVIGIYKD